MKIINILIIVYYSLAIILIPLSLFEINGKTILGAVGYACLVLGGVLSIVKSCIKMHSDKKSIQKANEKPESNSDNENKEN